MCLRSTSVSINACAIRSSTLADGAPPRPCSSHVYQVVLTSDGADSVSHLAFNHDFSKFAENCELDKRAIEAVGEAREGSDRPLLVTSGVALAQGRAATEDDQPIPVSAAYPRASEATTVALMARGVNASMVRLPQVHDRVRQGLVSPAIRIYREKGTCAHLIRAEVQQFLSSFRGCPRRLRQNPESSFCSIGPENWIPGSIADTAGDGPGMTSFSKVRDTATR
ncbi:MAG: hypothetical protein ACREPL_13555 [Rhodanobacteraceae bacterium]